MKIEFKKVTWYSKLAAVVVLIGIIFLANYFYNQYKEIRNIVPVTQDDTIREGEAVVMVGESATFGDLKVTLDRVIQDSRCPIGVNCIQAGNVTASVTLMSSSGTEEKEMISGREYKMTGYNISIVRVAPEKNVKTELDPNNYAAVFRVTKN